jgi:FkbM family methyltransferase
MELFRKTVRNILGPNSKQYRFVSSCIDAWATILKEGVWCWLLFRHLKKNAETFQICRLKFKNIEHPFTFRNHPSDIRTIVDNFIREEYGQLSLDNQPGWMIDAGAYLGDTTSYFISKYPTLKIIALEPNPETFPLAKQNLEPYGPNVHLVQKGLWSKSETLYLSGDTTSAGVADQGVPIEVIALAELIKEFQIDRIKLLKMDIEGAELNVFSEGVEDWIDRVDAMIIETHGTQVTTVVCSVAVKNGFLLRRYRNLWYFFRSK